MLQFMLSEDLAADCKLLVIFVGEAGWTPDQWGYSRAGVLSAATESGKKHLTAFMRSLLKASFQGFVSP